MATASDARPALPDPPSRPARPSLLVVAWELQEYGGLETRLGRLLDTAAGRGWPITLLTARRIPASSPLLDSRSLAWTTISLEDEWRRTPRGRLAVAAGRGRAAVRDRSLEAVRDTSRYGHQDFHRFVSAYWQRSGTDVLREATVIHLLGPPKRFLAETLLAANELGTPAAYQAVHQVSADYAARSHFAPFVGACNDCSVIFTSHAQQSADFREHFGYRGDTVQIPQWCYEDEAALLAIARPRADQRAVRVGSLCRFDEVKGLETVLEAVARATASGVELELILGGSGPLEAQLRQRAHEFGIADAVEFAGYVDDRPDFYRGIDATGLPSHSEGGPITGVEAMAAGLPILTTPVGAMPERLEHDHTGRFFPVGDAAALAAQLAELASDPELRSRLGDAARTRYLDAYRAEDHEHRMIDRLAGLSTHDRE